MLACLDELGPAFEIGLQPAEWYFCHSELELQAIEEEPVVDGVEGRRQVEAIGTGSNAIRQTFVQHLAQF